jgi:predicted ATPase
VAALAHGGQVLLTEATAALVAENLPDGTALRDLGEHRLKDFPRPARLYQLDVAGLADEFPPLQSRVRHAGLPASPQGLVGRDSDVEAVAALLREEQVRLVTVTGPGGIGKTRLALAAARTVAGEFPGGAVFVPLAAVVEPALVLSTVADAVGARAEPGVQVVDALAATIGDARTLLLLDNFEQVVNAAADVAALLERTPAVAALVTSRSVLRLRFERQYSVPPLTGSAAVRLFTERAAAVRPGFRLTEANTPAVTELCRRLDGLPLAIELAAARIRLLPPEALLARMDRRLDVLGSGPVDLPERQRTLRAAMDWSYELLAPHEQAVFRRLGVFAGGCPLQAAEAVCGRPGEPDVLDTVAELLADSLLVASEEADRDPRLHMLQTVRAYAAEKLAASPDRTETEQRHTDWVLGVTAALVAARGGEHRLAVERFDRELPNLRAAVQRALEAGDVATVARLTRDAYGYLSQRDDEGEAVTWLDRALALADSAPAAVRGRLLVLRALGAGILGDFDLTRTLLSTGWPLLPDDADHAYDQAAAAVTAVYAALAEDPAQAPLLIEKAATRFRELGHKLGQAHVELAGGDHALNQGDLATAERHYRNMIELAGDVGDDSMRARGLSLLGLTLLAQGDLRRARQSVVDGAQANLGGGQPSSMAYSLDGLAAVALADGRPEAAASALAAASAVREQIRHVLSPALRPLVDGFVSRSRKELGDRSYEAAAAQGRQWQVVDALDRTLRALSKPPAGTNPRTPSARTPPD